MNRMRAIFGVDSRRYAAVSLLLFGILVFSAGIASAATNLAVPTGQLVNGSPLTLVKGAAASSSQIGFTTDETDGNLHWRVLGAQSDGFNTEGTPAAKWSTTHIGGSVPSAAPSVALSGANGNGVLTVRGRGTDIRTANTNGDSFTYFYQTGVNGDFTIDVKVNGLSGTNLSTSAKAGIMARQSLATTSRHASIVITPSSGIMFIRRTTDGGTATVTPVTGQAAPRWLRLKRAGNTFSAWYSTTETPTWIQVGANVNITMSNLNVGLAVTSRSTSNDLVATFDNFMFRPNLSSMSETWSAFTSPTITATNWTSGNYVLAMRAATLSTAVPNTNIVMVPFQYLNCSDNTPSTISIPAGQTVSGSTVSLTGLFEHTGNVGSFTYKINGATVKSPWNSSSRGTVTPEDVSLQVSGIDPDCGLTISATQTLTVDNTCTDPTPSTLTIRTGQSVTGTSVDLTALFSKTGNVAIDRISIEGVAIPSNQWTSWNSSSYGTGLEPDSVNLEVSGWDNDCFPQHIIANNYIEVDNTETYNPPSIIFARPTYYVASGAQIDIPFTLASHDGYNNNVTTDYTLAIQSESNGTEFAPSVIQGPTVFTLGGGQSVTSKIRVTALAGMPEWKSNVITLQVTSSNPGAHGTVAVPVQAVIFLVSPITHNSVTTNSSKWGGSWGTSQTQANSGIDSKYGNFDCLICHEKNSPNVKWMKQVISTPDGSNWEGSGLKDLPITFRDARDGSDDWGNDDPDGNGSGRVGSARACEVCHSATQYHRYDTTGQPTLQHFNDRDCTDCHRHEVGFTAACDYCHGNPPIDDSRQLNAASVATGLAFTPTTTGSLTPGTHYKHVNVLQYECYYCHHGYREPGKMPDGVISLSFDVFNLPDEVARQGHYTGQLGVTYEKEDVNHAFIQYQGDGSLTCQNIYCHGATLGGSDAQWNSNLTCASCHGTSAAVPPPGLSHATHVGRGMTCNECHGNQYGHLGHVNGKVRVDISELVVNHAKGGTPSYRGVVTWDSPGLPPNSSYGTCSNINCHFGRETPPWNNNEQPATCTTCHNNGTDNGALVNSAPNTGAHEKHCNPAPGIDTLMVEGFINHCESCHGAGANTGTHIGHISVAGAANEPNFPQGMTYNRDNGSCANYCHYADAGPNNWFSSAHLPCHYCHMPRSDGGSYIGPTVVFPSGNDAPDAAANPYGSHLKAAKTETFNAGTNWDAQCKMCHPYHQGGVEVPLPPENWTAATGTSSPVMGSNMQERLGIQYAVTGGIHLGGTATGSSATEADMCWNCHGTDDSINEWGYNADTNGSGFPATIIPDVNGQSVGSHNYGWVYTDAAWTTLAKGWVTAAGKGMYRKDGYQHDAGNNRALSRRISSVHSVNFDLTAAQGSSVANNIDGGGAVIRSDSQILETPAQIRCSYCHDVHDLNRALDADGNQEIATGRPFLRGTWMGNPYAPDMPPLAGYSYPTTGSAYSGMDHGQRFHSNDNGTIRSFGAAVPRLWPNAPLQNKGGYFIDQNSNRPTDGRTLAETGGICVLCHGSNVDAMDYYTGSSMWRTGMVNGHSNSTLGGTGANRRNIFDAKRGAASWGLMANQDGVNYNKYGNASGAKSNAPWRTAFNNQPADGNAAASPPRNTGWYGGIIGSTDRGGQYGAWYNGTTTATTMAAVGTDGTTTLAHNFTCSKCHTPHAAGLPALLITNCLDLNVAKWTQTANNSVVLGPSATNAWAIRARNTCHEKTSVTTGWHRLAPGQ
ncbi:CxxxxCH/CxxCH domain c-type cytochrome [Geoalkalibacter sp.]|uniref:CxxxxCH/CxxCH domain c-type cytochrome n=1 Tax=Geoalkalibacter sp. TaxID=3041440 RepID=UPI00272E0810|nr:CxxxxCH/CxxCH domain-containing protein [Geoalkalibacter sp.]